MSGTPLFLFGLGVTVVVAVALVLRAYAAVLDVRRDHELHDLPPERAQAERRTPFHHT